MLQVVVVSEPRTSYSKIDAITTLPRSFPSSFRGWDENGSGRESGLFEMRKMIVAL
jgi:hypothetical protein